MSGLPPGHFRLVPFVEPPVPAGSYLLSGEVSGMPGEVEPLRSRVTVTSPRFTMPPDQVLSTYPPAGARGSFTSRLPQIVLRRRTLPWERSPDLDGNPATTPTPWLALVLIAEGEGQLLTDVPVAQCTSATLDLSDVDVPKGTCLEVPRSVVEKVFPTKEDLPLLTHVREVDLADTELALGDDDGWMAVVLGNRLPQPGVRYLACLVNLEGLWDELPVVPENQLVLEYAFAERVLDLRPAAGAVRSVDSAVMDLPLAQHVAGVAGPGAGPGDRAAGVTSAAPASIVTGATGAAAVTGSGWAATTATAASKVVGSLADAGLSSKFALADGFAIGVIALTTLKVPVLAHWSFTCEERGDFEYLARNVHVRMLGHVIQGAETPDGDPIGRTHPVTPGNAAQPGVHRDLPLVTGTGHLLLEHVSRRGEAAQAWFRGPLAPAAVPRSDPPPGEPPTLAHHADQLRRVTPDGHEDLGYASAFEIGRLLALSQPGVVAALSRWRQEAFGKARVASVVDEQVATALPAAMRAALARPDPLTRDPDAALRAPSTAARALRALVTSLGESGQAALGAPRPVADPGIAAQHLGDAVRGRTADLLPGLGVPVDLRGEADPDLVLQALSVAPVQVATEAVGADGTDDAARTSALLRARLEDAVGAVATDAAGRR